MARLGPWQGWPAEAALLVLAVVFAWLASVDIARAAIGAARRIRRAG
jgi:hypothetical protein